MCLPSVLPILVSKQVAPDLIDKNTVSDRTPNKNSFSYKPILLNALF